MGQLEWSLMFKILLDKFPDSKDQVVFSTGDWQKKFGVSLDDGVFECIGEDYPSYDTGIIYEDLTWVLKHQGLNWMISYIMDHLVQSDVWLGGLRISDVFWKSGHPFTSDLGSAFHLQIQFNIRDWAKKNKDPRVELVALSVLADDDISFWKDMNFKWFNEYLKDYGLSIKEDETHVYTRDKLVSYLKVILPWPIRGLEDGVYSKRFIGDPISRYLGLAHSERETKQDIEDLEDYSADIRGVWKITGKVELDQFISKIASGGDESAPLVWQELTSLRDTSLVREAILIIPTLDKRDIYPYREDVPVGFHPRWLAKLPVLTLLTFAAKVLGS
jgi:hypothetical protein